MYSQIFSIIFKSGDYASLLQRLLRFYLYIYFLQCGLFEQMYCHPWTSSFYLQHTRQLLAITSCLGCQYVLGQIMLPSTTVRVPTSSTQLYPHIKLIFRLAQGQIRCKLYFVLFSRNANAIVCTEHNLTFVGKCYVFPVAVYCSASSHLTPVFSIRFPNHHFLFR